MLERTLCIRTALRAVHGSYSTQIELMRHVQSDCAQLVHDSCSDATAEVGSGPAECLMSNADYRVKSSFAHSMLTLDAWGPARTVSWRASHGGRRIGLCRRVPHAYAIRYGVCTSGCVLLVCKVHSPFIISARPIVAPVVHLVTHTAHNTPDRDERSTRHPAPQAAQT